ncbi:MAG: PIN domain-containing protein [Chloroflexota bacterium]|nr:PIN domain-containing protein [Chloroflexota bacterium]
MPDSVFVDTAGWACLFVETEAYHLETKEWFSRARQRGVKLITTNYVLIELVTLLNSPLRVPRSKLFQYVDAVKTASYVKLVHVNEAIDAEAWGLLKSRADKAWSLVDATSFIVMKQFSIRDALTTDHHFKQAGLVRILK